MPAIFTDDFYTLAELASVLKVSKSTVWRRARDGAIPPLDPVFNRFRGDQLREWLQNGQKPWCQLAKAA